MHRLNLRRTLALAATPLLIAALAACGGDEQSADEPAAVSASEESSPAEDESAPAEEESAAAEEESADDTAEGEPVDKEQFLADFRAAVEDATTAHMSMTTEAAGSSFTADGEVDYSTNPPSMAMMMSNPTMGEQTMDIRLVDGFFYLNLGQMSQNKFVKVDVTDQNSPLGDISQLTSAMDPVEAFEKFAAGLDEVTLVGEESVDGEDLDHYLLTLDTAKVEVLQGAGAENLPATLEYDLWLDDEDRMRQVIIDMASTGSVEMKIFDWDEPVDIEAPAPNQITEMPTS